MNSTQKTIALAISGAFALSIASTSVNAAENPFAAKSLSSGYQVADADMKMKDGKCGTGKCGANKKKMMGEKMGGNAHEGADNADMAFPTTEEVPMDKAKEGSCSAEKMKEGGCSAEMRAEMGDKSAMHQAPEAKKHMKKHSKNHSKKHMKNRAKKSN